MTSKYIWATWLLPLLLLIGSKFPSLEASNNNNNHTNISGLNDITWTHSISLSDGILVKWASTDPTWITLEMSAPTRGYIGIGFSPHGGMAGSDLVIGWIDDDGVPHFKDYHGIKNGQPIEDLQQDYELIYGVQDDKGTKFVFRRKWDTCDEKHDIPIGDDTMRLIWATHPVDPIPGQPLPYHRGLRGTRSIFMKAPGKPTNFPDEIYPRNPKILHWDIALKNFEVPAVDTYYQCEIFRFPHLSKKHHIIGYKPLITPENVQFVHHINVFGCHVPEQFGSTKDYFEKYLSHRGKECYSPNSPRDWREYCYAFRVAHPPGSEGQMLPDHLGDPIGEIPEEWNYMRLEVHYDNPTHRKFWDNSGIRIFYTEELRKYDIAMLFVGHRRTPFLTLPPGQPNFKITGHCSPECTKAGFPGSGVKLFSVLLHAHQPGRKLTLRHVRNRKELPPIAQEHNYDFNYQEYRRLSSEVTVFPGDELIMECDYDTTSNNTFIFGGLSARREMCEAFIYYYPSSSLVDCRSQPELYSYLSPLGVLNVTGNLLKKLHLPYEPDLLPENERRVVLPDDAFVIDLESLGSASLPDVFQTLSISSPATLSTQTLQTHLENLPWGSDPTFVAKVEREWREGPRYMHCAAPGALRLQNVNHISSISKFQTLEAKGSSCADGPMNSGSSNKGQPQIKFIVIFTWTKIIWSVFYSD